jgi:hypothetical protein
MPLETLTTFFGWLAVLNIGLLMFMTLFIWVLMDWASCFHARLFGLDQRDVRRAFYGYLAQYKLLTLIFVITPYVALKLM